MPIDTPLSHGVNQYTSRTVPGAVDVVGSATNTATVTVNNVAASRHGTYYRVQLSFKTARFVRDCQTALLLLLSGSCTR